MSNPTTPFGWQMPTNTDLVTDLPADFEVFGQAVATSMADLLGGTTGQILAKNSNTDMDFVWIANDQGDITGVTATSPLTGGGTSGAITVGIQAASTTQSGAVQLTDSTSSTSTTTAATPNSVKTAFDTATTANTTANAAIPKSTVTTAGDVIYATGSSAVTRLGIGSTGQVLTVAGGVPSWATPTGSGGMTVLASGSLSGAAITMNSISQSYKHLQLVVRDWWPSTDTFMYMRFNNASVANSYTHLVTVWNGTAASVTGGNYGLMYMTWLNADGANYRNFSVSNIYDYTNTVSNKQVEMNACYVDTTGSFYVSETDSNFWNQQTPEAITRIDLALNAGTFSGGTYTLYGVN